MISLPLQLHVSQIVLSFTVRSVGKNKEEGENTVGDRLLELFLHSLGAMLTSVQDTEMKYGGFFVCNYTMFSYLST